VKRVNVTKGTAEALQECGIQPSAQRVAVGEYVLRTHEHPSADLVWKRVRERFPWISRATVYNSLNLFVEKGLLRRLTFAEDSVVFDPRVDTHHHFIDDETGEILDVPWDKVQVCNIESMRGYDISDYQVVMHGTRKKRQTKGE
jgi:Fe2+ or Zn2+ uptake regulation protein